MKIPLLPIVTALGLACAVEVSFGAAPNYLVTHFFKSPDAGDVYTITDFNDQGMVCGTWKRPSPVNLQEEAGGVFVWREGVMRKITPQQAGISYTSSPTTQGSRVGGQTKMTNVRGDGTLLLVAPALQSKSTPNGVQPIYRLIVYTLHGNLADNPDTVISGRQLGGFIRPNYNGSDLNYEDSADVRDITEDGTVLGYPSSWNFFYPPTQIWFPYGGHAPRYFDLDLRRTLGDVAAFDHEGRIIGTAYDANPPQLHFMWDAPLGAGVTPTAVAGMTIWPSLSGFYGDQADGTLMSGLPHAHGDFRAIGNSLATAVWSNRYQNVAVVRDFRIHHSAVLPPRTRLTKSGHMLGYDMAGASDSHGDGYALARRSPQNETYAVSLIRDETAPSYKLYPPFHIANPVLNQYYDQAIYPLAVNAGLDILGYYTDDGTSFYYVLKNLPDGGKLRYEPTLSSAAEADGQARITLRRTLGRTGAASVRVSLAAGGTALATNDFASGTSRILTWNDGEAGLKSVSLPVLNDYVTESPETLNVTFSEVGGASMEGTPSGLVTIQDDDPPGPGIPEMSGFPPLPGVVGEEFFYSANFFDGVWPPVWSASGLPPGLSIGPSSGLITGKPKQSGTFAVVLTARNYAGTSAPFPVEFQIAPAPADAPLFFTSPPSVAATAGQPFSYQATATGTGISWNYFWMNPPPGIFAALPPGFAFNISTGRLSGTFSEQQVGTVKIQISGERGSKSNSTLLEIVVAPAGGIFSPLQRWLADNKRPYAGAAGAPQLDPDGNGLGNMLELAFGLTSTPQPLPSVTTKGPYSGAPQPGMPSSYFDSSTSPRLVVSLHRSKAAMALGFNYIVEFSSSLQTWDQAVSYTVVDSGNSGDIINVPDPNPGPLVGDTRSWRIRVTAP